MFAPAVFQLPTKYVTYEPSRVLMASSGRNRPGRGQTNREGKTERTPWLTLPCLSRAALLDALQTDQIQAWLQPKVSVKSQQLVALEALARWRHPSLGILSPDVFLPWFRAQGLDEALLMHILQEVLGFQAYWRQRGLSISVSVNLPTHLLDDSGLPDRLMASVQSRQGRACDITFELLEDSDTHSDCALFMGASRLVSLEFGLAQDDVGVGYSSMKRLACAPFTEVKLDRSLVQGLAGGSQQAARALTWVETAKKRGLRVTAEGVETQADLELLEQIGVDYAQGYLFAKPMPAFELDMWMRQRKAI